MKTTINSDMTALELICQMHQGISNQKAKKIIKSSTFLCNKKAMDTIPSTKFTVGQEVEILRNTVTQVKDKHPDKNRPVVIKYEDKFLIVAIKPVGILSCKSRGQKGVSFDQMLNEYVSKRDKTQTRLWIAHRIDREVEGLIIFAKTEEVQQKIKDNWDKVTKKYLALTESKPSPASGVIQSWLKEGFRHKMYVLKKAVEDAVFAKTEYKFLKPRGKYSLLEIKLHTGRKNQIRAHLSSIGCPIVGDFTYDADASVVRQVRLVAYSLDFQHPIISKRVQLDYQPKASFYRPSQGKDEVYK